MDKTDSRTVTVPFELLKDVIMRLRALGRAVDEILVAADIVPLGQLHEIAPDLPPGQLAILVSTVDDGIPDLGVRAANCVQNACCTFVFDLVQKTEEDLIASRNFNERRLQEVKDKLAARGLKLGMKFSEGELCYLRTWSSAKMVQEQLESSSPTG